MEQWKEIAEFPRYGVSNLGSVRNERTGRILVQSMNQYGSAMTGLMRDGKQYHRSIPLLVATAFIPQLTGVFDTPINLDGDRRNNRVTNLDWRPRWFAVKYNQQFRFPYEQPILFPIRNKKTREVYPNSFTCAWMNGLLEKDLVLSILNLTYVWPTYQEFEIVEE